MRFKTEKQTRRSFLKKFTLLALAVAFVAQARMFIRFLLFNSKAGQPRRFKIGPPTDFDQGVTFLPEHKLFIIRRGNQFRAISAVCTHLGCTVKMAGHNKDTISSISKSASTFKCPCHGSQFDVNGQRTSGPAQKALPSYALFLSENDGQLVVDTNKMGERFTLTV